jgi:uncharacterized membrane protein
LRRAAPVLAVSAAVLLAAGGDAREAHAQSKYQFIRLSAPDGYSSGGYGVNDAGHVVGIVQAGGAYATAFYWSDENNNGASDLNEMQHLGTFGGSYSNANAINSSDVVVGSAALPGNTEARAYIWTPGQGALTLAQNDLNNRIDPSTLPAGWVVGTAYDINDSGVIAGAALRTVTNPDGTTSASRHPCVLTPSATQPGLYAFKALSGVFPATTQPAGAGVSSTGAVVVRGNQYNSFFWDGVSPSLTTTTDVFSTNASGTIVGRSAFGTSRHASAAMGPHAAPQDLGTLGGTFSRAWDINDGGMFSPSTPATTVGEANVIVTPATRGKAAVEVSHAFRWQGSGSLLDLNTFVPAPAPTKGSKTSWYLMAAYAISPNGTIVGISGDGGTTPNCAYVMIPIAP